MGLFFSSLVLTRWPVVFKILFIPLFASPATFGRTPMEVGNYVDPIRRAFGWNRDRQRRFKHEKAFRGLVHPAGIVCGSICPGAELQLEPGEGGFQRVGNRGVLLFSSSSGILAGPTVRIGRVENDGKGNVHVRAIASLNGFVFAEEYPGVLTVNPDCTTEVTFDIPFPVFGIVPLAFKGVISDNFRQHDIILDTIGGGPPASTVIISLRQQNRSNCSNRDLRGGYALNMRGFTDTLPGPPVPFVRLGQIVFDGWGTFSARTHYSDGSGPLFPDHFNGTYAVSPSCEFTMSYDGNTWAGDLMDNSSAANLMVSVPNPALDPFPLGVAVSGTLTRQ